MKVLIESYGCSTNQSLGEYLQGRLSSKGFKIVNSVEEADVIVLNTCTVKGRTQHSMIRRIRRLHKLYGAKRLVIAGCMPTVQSKLLSEIAPGSLRFGTYEYEQIPDALAGGSVTGRPDGPTPYHPRKPSRPGIGIVPISTGCLGNCTYCIVRLIKGRLRSYPAADVVEEVRRCRDQGCHELWLTSQDLAAYGADGAFRLPDLLKSILDVAGTMRIRLGMMNPSSLLPLLDEMIEVWGDARIYKFLHLPIQSGSNAVLKSMQRNYAVEDWMAIVEAMRTQFPRMAVSTDVIVGYPTERDEDFQQTLGLLRRAMPDVINISRYEHRPGTPAAELKALPSSEVKRRSRIAWNLSRAIALQANAKWLGWRGRCLVSERGAKGGFLARNDSYKPIIVGGPQTLGSVLKVEVTGVRETYLIGSKGA